jgi:hypothetical protein
MSTPIAKARIVALCYAILAAMYLTVVAVLVNSIWLGSLSRLWLDAQNLSSTLIVLFGLFSVHASMSLLSLTYTRRGPRWRLTILAAAICLFISACYRAVSMAVVWFRGPWEQPVPQLIVPANALLVFGYGACAWILWQIHATSNKRLERAGNG